jgi:hypothetical protein
MRKILIITIAAFLMLLSVNPIPANATQVDSQVIITAGSLSIKSVAGTLNFGSLDYDATTREISITDTPIITVLNQGHRTGWNISVKLDGNFVGSAGNTDSVPANNLSYSPVGESVNPAGNVTALAYDGVIGTTDRKLFSAALNKGNGEHVLTTGTFRLTVPDAIFADTYRANLVITLTNTP